MRSISVTPVQQQQAKQDALERSSIASSASSSSSQRGHTRPSFDSVGLRSNYTVSSSRSQAANISTIPSAASARPPRAFSRPHSITQSSTHPSCRPRVQSPDSGSAPRSVREPPLRSARHRQRPTKPDGSFAPSIAPSSMLTPPSVYSQATTSSGYSTAASADYNPLTYRPKDAVRTYRASESFKPIPDSDTFSIPPPPLAPSFHPTMPVTYFPRDPPNDHYVDGTPRTTPHATSMHTLTGSRAPPPQTGTTTPTTSVAWSDTDYHLENGRIVDSGQSSVTNGSSTYLPSLVSPLSHAPKTD